MLLRGTEFGVGKRIEVSGIIKGSFMEVGHICVLEEIVR